MSTLILIVALHVVSSTVQQERNAAAGDVFEIFRRAAVKAAPAAGDDARRAADVPVLNHWREEHGLNKLPPTTSTTKPTTMRTTAPTAAAAAAAAAAAQAARTTAARETVAEANNNDSPFLHHSCDIKCAIAGVQWLALPLQSPEADRFVVELQLSVTDAQGVRMVMQDMLSNVIQLRISSHRIASVDDVDHGAMLHADLRPRESELNEIQLEPMPNGPLWHLRLAVSLSARSVGVAATNKTHVLAPHNAGGDWRIVTRHAVPLLPSNFDRLRDSMTLWFKVVPAALSVESGASVRVCLRDTACSPWQEDIDSVAFGLRSGRVRL
jgi:hypothetical protein